MKFQITRLQWLVELNKYIERIIPVTDSCSRDNSQMDLAHPLITSAATDAPVPGHSVCVATRRRQSVSLRI